MTSAQTAIFAVLVVVYAMLSFAAGYLFGDAHLINRMGAALAAIGALMIIFQVRREVRIEHENRDDLAAIRGGQFSRSDRTRVEAIRSQREIDRYRERMRMIVCIAILVFVGEIMHGWGDMLLQRVAGVAHH